MGIRLGLVAVAAILAVHSSLSSARPAARTLSRTAAEQAETTRIAKTGAGVAPVNTDQTVATIKLCPRTNPSCGINVPGLPVLDPGSDACGPHSSATLVAAPPTIRQGQSTTLQWAVTYPSPCTPPVIKVNGQTVGTHGSMTVAPMANYPYGLLIGNTVVTQITVTVELPAVVRIKGNTGDWQRLLIQALGDPLPGLVGVPQEQRPGRTVLLAHDVDMNLTNYVNIRINQGVTLTSELPPPGNAPALAFLGFPGGPGSNQGPVGRPGGFRRRRPL